VKNSGLGLSWQLWTMSDICKVSDGTRVVLKGVIAWIQKVPNNDQLSLIVTKIIDSPNSFPID
jgi:hypothetical protein